MAINYGPGNPTGKCRECGGPNYGKYAVCQACMRKPIKATDSSKRARMHRALDAVMDARGAAKDGPWMPGGRMPEMLGPMEARTARVSSLEKDLKATRSPEKRAEIGRSLKHYLKMQLDQREINKADYEDAVRRNKLA